MQSGDIIGSVTILDINKFVDTVKKKTRNF